MASCVESEGKSHFRAHGTFLPIPHSSALLWQSVESSCFSGPDARSFSRHQTSSFQSHPSSFPFSNRSVKNRPNIQLLSLISGKKDLLMLTPWYTLKGFGQYYFINKISTICGIFLKCLLGSQVRSSQVEGSKTQHTKTNKMDHISAQNTWNLLWCCWMETD